MSVKPPIQPPLSPPAQRRLDQLHSSREAIAQVLGFIWPALGRHGVPYGDRADLVQDIVLAALEAWPSYDAEIASPQKWLNGIILHHVARWRGRRARHPLPTRADYELRDETQGADEVFMSEEMRKLVHQLYQEIPFKYRDAMIAYEIDGLTLGEIAASRGIPVSTAHRYVEKGKQLLRAAFERWQEGQRSRGVLLLPVTVKALLDADRSPAPVPDHVVELAWRLVQQKLGRAEREVDTDDQGHSTSSDPEDDPDGSAPAYPRPEDEKPHPVAPAAAEPPMRLPPKAGTEQPLGLVGVALVVGLLVGLLAGAWLDSLARAPRDPIAREAPPLVSAAPPIASIALAPAPSSVASAAPPEPLDTTAPPAGTGKAISADFAGEQATLDKARAAFGQGRMAAALEALEEHAQRYPRSANAPARDELRIQVLLSLGRTAEACEHLVSFRRAHPTTGAVERLRAFCP